MFVLELKKNQEYFLVISNKISIDSYLNEKFGWVNQIFVDSTRYFIECIIFLTFLKTRSISLNIVIKKNKKIVHSINKRHHFTT